MTWPDTPTTADPGSPDDPIALAEPIRPQEYGRARADEFEQPLIEPLWLGLRVIAAATSDEAALFADGQRVDGQDAVHLALRHAVGRSAGGAIIDGYLIKEAGDDEAAAAAIVTSDSVPPSSQLVTKSFLGIRRNRSAEKIKQLDREEAARTFTDDDVVHLIVTDLLWLDSQWLLDVPLLERRRVLESVIPATDVVRCGPYIRPPYQTWIGSWRAQGFTGISFKEANSRYRPGETSDAWTTADLPRR